MLERLRPYCEVCVAELGWLERLRNALRVRAWSCRFSTASGEVREVETCRLCRQCEHLYCRPPSREYLRVTNSESWVI